MPMQPFVRDAIEQMKQNARELLNGQHALTDPRQRTMMISIEGSTRILLNDYDGYVNMLASAEAWLIEEGYYETIVPLSPVILESIAGWCHAMRVFQPEFPLTDQQLQHLEAIEHNHEVVFHELRPYIYVEWQHKRGSR